jgi:hypothetical protein
VTQPERNAIITARKSTRSIRRARGGALLFRSPAPADPPDPPHLDFAALGIKQPAFNYAQAEFGYRRLDGRHRIASGAFLLIPFTTASEDIPESLSYLAFAVFGRFPIVIGRFSIIPMAGFEFDLNLTYTDAGGNDLKAALTDRQRTDLNEMWLKGGVALGACRT